MSSISPFGDDNFFDLDKSVDIEPTLSSSERHPILTLPSELLAQIFIQCLPLFPSLDATEAPLLLTHVCQDWRNLAIRCPPLWDSIHLPLSNYPLTERDFFVSELFLERSGARLLNIDLGLLTNVFPWMIKTGRLMSVERFLQKVVDGGHAKRVRRLDRVFPEMLHKERFLEKMIRLEELLVCDNQAIDVHEYPPGIRLPETMKQLTLCQTSYDLRRIMPLPQLTQLSMWQLSGSARLSVPFVIDLLRHLPHLEMCTLDLNAQQESVFGHHEHELVILTHLHMLVLSWDDPVDVGPILDCMVAPKITKLVLAGPPPVGLEHWDYLKTFLSRCRPPLENLCIGELCQIDIHLLECLRMCDEITHLSLAHCSLRKSLFEALAHKKEFKARDLLPKLLHASLEWCTLDDIGDLLNMLQSRGRGLDPEDPRQRIEEVVLRLKDVGPEIGSVIRDLGICYVEVRPWMSLLYLLHYQS